MMATPSSEAVRLRNSLIFEVVTESDLRWEPGQAPSDFRYEPGKPPDSFVRFVSLLPRDVGSNLTGWEFARAVGQRLTEGGVRGGAIQGSTEQALDRILADGAGYCADYTQVVNGLAHAANVPVREWGMSFDGFGGNGHAFNEIYDPALAKWVFVDVFYGFFVLDKETEEPLSALEFQDRLLEGDVASTVRLMAILESGIRFRSDEQALDYYRRGMHQFYLWNGNNVFQFDRAPLVRAGAVLSRSLEQILGIVNGVQPSIKIPQMAGNKEYLQELHSTRNSLLAVLTVFVASSAATLFLIIQMLRRRYWIGRSGAGRSVESRG